MTHHAQAQRAQQSSATQILMDEHRVIERMLNAMAKISHRLSEGGTPEEWVLAGAGDFMSGFADACHHAKEEKRLFPMLVHLGMPANEGPIPVMLAEHEQGRQYNREMRAAAGRLMSDDETARQELIGYINGYIGLLRIHIKKEDNALFPMADRLMSAAQQRELLLEFDEVEREDVGEGAHKTYLILLSRVEKAVSP